MDARNVDELTRFLAAGNSAKYLYFWGHRQRGSAVDQSCLSQWFPARFSESSRSFPTAEHYMMWRKAELFADFEIAAEVLEAGTPGNAKALGRKVRQFDEQTWIQHRWDIVVSGNLAKFSQNAGLRRYLLATDDRVIVEASPVDSIWGIGLDKAAAMNLSPGEWQGENILGFALMEVRDRLRRDTL